MGIRAEEYLDMVRSPCFPCRVTRLGKLRIVDRCEFVERVMSSRAREVTSSSQRSAASRLTAPGTMEGAVYFIGHAGAADLVKIGYTTNIRKRLGSLQCANGRKLVVLHTVSGTMADERALHERFASARREGEWFEPTAELLAYINELRAGLKETA